MAVVAQRRPPAAVTAGLTLLTAGVLVPLLYLGVRAFEAEWAEVGRIVLRQRNAVLLVNTAMLLAGVLALSTVLAFPLAWLTTRTRISGSRFIALAGVLPLAFPAYLMAYSLLGMGGYFGAVAQLTPWTMPRITGFWGALLVLSFCNFPYLFFNLRSALSTLDPGVEEVAYSLGQSRRRVFVRIVLPQLKPALLAGMLLIGLHVLSDFAAVSLVGFETFSYALYNQYIAGMDRTYAAWLALMLLGMTGAVLLVEAWFLRGVRLDRAGAAGPRPPRRARLGWWSVPAYGFVALVLLLTLIAPLGTMFFWMTKAGAETDWGQVGTALMGSVGASLPAAFVATLLVVPIVYVSTRMPSRWTRWLERSTYLGYATPSLAFALGLIFLSINTLPFLYQSLALLIYAYTMHFMAEAVGPMRSALLQSGPRIEEAARSLGYGWLQSFLRVTAPLLRNAFVVSLAFIFLSCMKELQLTLLLAPLGYETLAIDVWDFVENAMFAEAAPYALTILLFSGLFVGIFLLHERRHA